MPLEAARSPLASSGNAAVLVVIDSRRSESLHVPETTYAALRHFGMPYRVHDLAHAVLTRDVTDGAACLLLAQENLGLFMRPGEIGCVLESVQDGVGLVSLDRKVAAFGTPYLDALGVAEDVSTGGVTGIGGIDRAHPVNRTQASGAAHRLRLPVPGSSVRVTGVDTHALVDTDTGAPAVIATRFGRGRIVQWLVSSRMWQRQFFGHASGLDDLFWKAIVWAARKPFAMLAMPPFVRIRLDDCDGHYRSAEDLAFVDVLTRHGHKPNLCICMNALDDTGWSTLKRAHDAGRADISPHTWQGGVSIFYGNGEREYSCEEAGGLIRATREMMDARRITPSRILSDHNHETSVNALPHLHELGIAYKMNVMLPGETWEGVHRDWRPAPYGSMSYCLDTMPGEPALFVAFTHHPNFDFCRSFLDADRFTLNRDGGFAEFGWDFMNGLTTPALGANDVERMAERLAANTRLGVNSLFFGGSVSHSHFTKWLSLPEWDRLLTRAAALMDDLALEYERYDVIAAYAQARAQVSLVAAERSDGAVRVRLSGPPTIPLRLATFSDESCRPAWAEIEARA